MTDQQITRTYYPQAKELPMAGDPSRIWIVTGTGYTIGCGTTSEKAWRNSVQILHSSETFE